LLLHSQNFIFLQLGIDLKAPYAEIQYMSKASNKHRRVSNNVYVNR